MKFKCFRCGEEYDIIFKSKIDNKLCKYCYELDDEGGELCEV